MATDEDAVRELLGPVADLPAPVAGRPRREAESTGGIIPGTGRRVEDHQPTPPDAEPGQ